MAHPGLHEHYPRQRPGLPATCVGSPPERTAALRDLGANFSLEDRHSPDLMAVLDSIAHESGPRRRKRAAAMLAVLSRSWSELSELAEVEAVHGHYGWNRDGVVHAWWLWIARSTPWLDNAAKRPCAPADLCTHTQAALAVHGDDKGRLVHRDLLAAARPELLSTLGVSGEPEDRELVDRLVALRNEGTPTGATAAHAALVYQSLAQRLVTPGHQTGRLSQAKLREAFGAGLVLAGGHWHKPTEVLRGEPVFGDLRPFVPATPGTDQLWKALHIREPNAGDCIDVLRSLARRRNGDVEELTLDVLRKLAALLESEPPGEQLAKQLRRLPLRTTQGFVPRRPVLCSDDLALVAGVGEALPIWLPGGELAQFRSLVPHLGIREITADEAPLAGVLDAHFDEDVTTVFRDAVELLREDLARNEPQAAAAMTLTWDQLIAFDVRIAPVLTVNLDAFAGSTLRIDVAARADRTTGALYLTNPSQLDLIGGRAIASLFGGDQRRLAQAWTSAVGQAREGRQAMRVRTAAERLADDARRSAEDLERLVGLRHQIAERANVDAGARGYRQSPAAQALPPAVAQRSAGPAGPRSLVDPSTLVLRNHDGVVTIGERQSADTNTTRRSEPGPPVQLPTPKPGGAVPQARSGARGYTDLDKESLGLELLRWVLASGADGLVDVRAQLTVGADAIDELKQFYELKVYAGAEPDEINLEPSQVERALSTTGFFLVVVSGLEDGSGPVQVRIIVNPLSQLQLHATSRVRLSGVRTSNSLVFPFEQGSNDVL